MENTGENIQVIASSISKILVFSNFFMVKYRMSLAVKKKNTT